MTDGVEYEMAQSLWVFHHYPNPLDSYYRHVSSPAIDDTIGNEEDVGTD